MDGVIADFVKRYKELYRMEPKEAEKSKKFDSFFDEFIATNQFATLDLMPDAMDAITYLRKLNVPTQILSSTANEKRYDDISKQKMIWLQTHGITFTPNFVPGKKYKYKYAAPDKIIIDDTESVIEDWRKAGGIGILHKDWPTTLAILRLYV
jgi:predicted pyridoxine 5'-phosphate oxidase superfamily flavin-nucleotide-binding protein